MIEPISATKGVIAGWKILSGLYEKYTAWSVKNKKSKEAKELLVQANELMIKINTAVLSGKSSTDPELAPLIKEFNALLAKDVRPAGADRTAEWIAKIQQSPSARNARTGPIKLSAGSSTKTMAVKKAAKPVAKKATASPAAKKAGATSAAKTSVSKTAAKKASTKTPVKRATRVTRG